MPKMQENTFGGRTPPDWTPYQQWGHTSKGDGGKGEKGEGKGRKKNGKKGRGRTTNLHLTLF